MNKNKTVPMDGQYGDLEGELFYKQLAIESCINLIANCISRSEFLTFEDGKEVRKDNYYLFNVRLNQNLSASEFWKKAVYKLFIENKLLIVQINDNFYIADSFSDDEYALKDNIYKDVVINDYDLKDTFKESDVFHLTLNNSNIKNLIDGLYMGYAKLIKAGQLSYIKSKTRRGVLNVPSTYPQTPDAQDDLTDIMNNRLKTFFQSEKDVVLPLTNGLNYEELGINNKGKSVGEVRDVRSYIDDIFDFVGIAFNVPPSLIKNDIADTEQAINNLLMFCINPLAKLISDEINMKFYRKADYLNRTYTKLDTSRIRVTTLKDIANALDILTRIGAYTIDDSLRALGKETINKPYANERFMTKNYEKISEGGT
ncbi:histone H1 [Clostridium botulinum]|uniref:phage portal protein n=1 Tax=Clostridium botulinum TaxID=1491 RepID=UPI0002074FF4|nr:phage portal protein [Clostridium botulinum]AEB77640.1 HK97 family phage portal potein [Clostridium botulinum BKT015925]KOA86406.1 histone H1 [Clostridium botulinum]KOC34057.1 histone H1 [Clostridium botulinum]KOC42090.1 histone H1 [Clostridium botulinum]MCD3211057.1 phage portal protein [Clostridium botulinum C/D]